VNIREYIASGIVESYVLGLASDDERREFEQLCAKYPELVEARNHFEELMEKQAIANAEDPPANSRSRIWSAIQESEAASTAKVMTMDAPAPRRSGGMTWLAAASIILMLGAGYFAYDYYKKNNDLAVKIEEMQSKINQMDSIMTAKAEEEKIMHDPNVKVVNMKAMKPAAPSADIYWDTTSANVYMVVKNMPKLASDKQYQLWSIIDNLGKLKPTSLGLFDGGNEKMFFKIPNVKNADAFAITIENAGNTGGPDMDQMQLHGKTRL